MHILYIILQSHPDSPRARGFKVTIESVPFCGGTIDSTSNAFGYIMSSNFPLAYPRNLVCTWFFEVSICIRTSELYSSIILHSC